MSTPSNDSGEKSQQEPQLDQSVIGQTDLRFADGNDPADDECHLFIFFRIFIIFIIQWMLKFSVR